MMSLSHASMEAHHLQRIAFLSVRWPWRNGKERTSMSITIKRKHHDKEIRNRTCDQCGTKFIAKKNRQQLCSVECCHAKKRIPKVEEFDILEREKKECAKNFLDSQYESFYSHNVQTMIKEVYFGGLVYDTVEDIREYEFSEEDDSESDSEIETKDSESDSEIETKDSESDSEIETKDFYFEEDETIPYMEMDISKAYTSILHDINVKHQSSY